MQQCKKCNSPFSWKQIYRSFLGWGYKPIICDKCGTRHLITATGRLIVTSLIVLPMLTFMNFLSPFENVISTIGFGILIAFIGSLLIPYVVKYKDA